MRAGVSRQSVSRRATISTAMERTKRFTNDLIRVALIEGAVDCALIPSQLDNLLEITEGNPAHKAIAEVLKLSQSTVKDQATKVLRKTCS
jgi:DNA-binding NarL/FixJ family response regulator